MSESTPTSHGKRMALLRAALYNRLKSYDWNCYPSPAMRRLAAEGSWIDFRDGYLGLFEPDVGPPITRFWRAMDVLVEAVEEYGDPLTEFFREKT